MNKITEKAICKSQQLSRGGKWRREENAVWASGKEACFMTADMAGKGALGKKQKRPKCQKKLPEILPSIQKEKKEKKERKGKENVASF